MDGHEQALPTKMVRSGAAAKCAPSAAVSRAAGRFVDRAILRGPSSRTYAPHAETSAARRRSSPGAAVFRIISRNGKTLLLYQFIQEDDSL